MKRNLKWKTKSGEMVEIKKMTDVHLHNSIKFLIRFAESERIRTINFYCFCPVPEGDIAEFIFDGHVDNVFESPLDDYLPLSFYNLVNEYRKRKLPMEEISNYMDYIKKDGLYKEIGVIGREFKKLRKRKKP
jgi:hypothetical protein